MQIALTIAGSDPSGGAGIQADLKTFQALGVFGMTVITAITVQNTQKVYSVQEITPEVVKHQILCLFDDIKIDVVKIGMVSNPELITAISKTLKSIAKCPIIIDPVMISKSGYPLLRNNAQISLINELIPIASIITPNLYEAEIISGFHITNIEDMKLAAQKIHAIGIKNVVIKGGHLEGHLATDVVFDGNKFSLLKTERIETFNTHGTGCTLSSAIASYIAKGYEFSKAISCAKIYITGAIKNALNVGKGCGPVNHFFDLYRRAKIKF